MHNPDDKPSNFLELFRFSNFSTFMQYMSLSHGHNSIGGIEYGGCGEDKKKEIVSHQLGISTSYGYVH